MRKIIFVIFFVYFSIVIFSTNSYSNEVTKYETEDRSKEITIVKKHNEQFDVHIYASYASANGMINIGELDGVGVVDGNSMSVFSKDAPDCRILINFFNDYVDVSGGDSACGFGLNVTANGRYFIDASVREGENSDSKVSKNDFVENVKNSVMNIDASTTLGNAIEGYEYFEKTYWESDTDKQKRNIVRSCSIINKNYVMDFARKESMDKSKTWVGIYSKLTSQDPMTIQPEQSEYEELLKKFNKFYLYNDFLVSVSGDNVSYHSTKIVITDNFGGTLVESIVEDVEFIESIYKNDMLIPNTIGKVIFDIARDVLTDKYRLIYKDY